MCIWSSNITSMREVDVFFLQDHKFCKKKNAYWFAGGCHSKITQTRSSTNRHACSYTSGGCMSKGRGFSGFVSHKISLFCL